SVIEFSHDYTSFLKSGKFSDVKLIVGGRTFTAHKIFLAKRSTAFAEMLDSSPDQIIPITDVSVSVFEQILNYIYTCKIDLMVCENVKEYLVASELVCLIECFDSNLEFKIHNIYTCTKISNQIVYFSVWHVSSPISLRRLHLR